MRRGIRRLGKYILLLLFLICFGYMLSLHTSLSRSGAPVIYYPEENALSYDTLTSMRENEEGITTGAAGTTGTAGATETEDTTGFLSYTAVETVENQTFSNEVLERSATGTLLLIDGSSANLVSATGELMEDDLTGCVLSTEAAWELFGETEVTGGEVLCSGVSFEVRGVYEDTECVLILPAEALIRAAAASELYFDMLVAMPDDNLSDAERSEAIEVFETKYGLDSDSVTDCMIYKRLSTVCVMLVPTILMLCVLGRGIAGLVRNRRRPFRLALLCITLIAVIVVFFRFFQISPSIPADLIPNTWSDLDFWKDKMSEFATAIQRLLFQSKSGIELNYYKPFVRLAALTGTGVLLLVVTNLSFRTGDRHFFRIGRLQPGSLRFLFLDLAGVFATELVAICLLRQWRIFLDGKRMLIYLWPYFLMAKYVVTLNYECFLPKNHFHYDNIGMR
ncbi:MAG: hypothetical protein LUE92_17955 [Clostridiales bacterium]|nr:hypothetical protein [Clostridiales bacterium]